MWTAFWQAGGSMRSILQTERECWWCGANGAVDPLDLHHVYSGPLRGKSEEYGLTVWLCHHAHHIFGAEAVHRNRSVRELLQRYAQETAMEYYEWTEDDFRRIFGKSYL